MAEAIDHTGQRLFCPFCGQRETIESGGDIRCRWCGATVPAEWWNARSVVRLRIVKPMTAVDALVSSMWMALELLAEARER